MLLPIRRIWEAGQARLARVVSTRAHALSEADPLLDPARPFAAGARDPLTGGSWCGLTRLAAALRDAEVEAVREATRTGRPAATKHSSNDWRMSFSGPAGRR